jgi:hypothetical protein
LAAVAEQVAERRLSRGVVMIRISRMPAIISTASG